MSFNLYDDVEEKESPCEQQFQNFEGETQMCDLYHTIHESPLSQKWSINKINTGLSKSIRKMRLLKKPKTNQYVSEGQNFIIQNIVSLNDACRLNNQQNMNLTYQPRDLNKIIKQMMQLNLQ